ncbi:hypothetical protein [Peribacillus sp. NPDC097295]|uniref:hypothetical protein n=1 Tax=Peribacillus sp. NPDC097295 TaxID=3364402 RepID=UPI00382D37FC
MMIRMPLNLLLDSETSLQSYSTINRLYEHLKELLDTEVFNETFIKYASDLTSVFHYINNERQNPEYTGRLATLELQAITLRLSRHHIKRAKTIENIARFFEGVLESTSIERISFNKAEMIDRPSLMVLNRLAGLLNKKKNAALITFHFSKDVFKTKDEHFAIQARRQVFEKIKRIGHIEIYNPDNNQLLSKADYPLEQRLYEPLILDSAIIEQNFELALLILDKTLNNSSENKIISNQLAYRHIGVIEANLGNFDKAMYYFEKAIENSQTILELSRNSYIKGLCLIKRLKKAEEGLAIINKAYKDISDYSDEDDFRIKHEKAWLMNGRSLAKTVLAARKNEKEKAEILATLIKEEMTAYRLISNESNFRLVYLKYNLLANIAFLLEIAGEFSRAIQFWEQAFAPLLANDGQFKEGEKALTYRLGLLHIKLSKLDQAELLLQRALDLTREENNDFHLHGVLYGLGYLKIVNHEYGEALQLFREGKEVAGRLDDRGSMSLFDRALDYAYRKESNHDLEFPKIKLTSYIPYLDLSFVPEVDLNKELTT